MPEFKYYNLYKLDKEGMKEELLFGSYVKEQVIYELESELDHGTPRTYFKIEAIRTTEKPDREIYDESEIKQIYKAVLKIAPPE